MKKKKVYFDINEKDHKLYSLFLQTEGKSLSGYAREVFVEKIQEALEASPKKEALLTLMK